MLMTKARLQTSLARWQAEGWVSPTGADAIRRELSASGSGSGLYGALAVLGAVLLGFAGMSFVAAHWDTLSKLSRLAIMGGGIVASYVAAYQLFTLRLDAFAHAAVLTGISFFGGSIMLIAQMYHMDGNPPDAVLLWAMGALTAGLLLRSNPVLAASLVLICTWSAMTVAQDSAHVHWGFLPMWAITAGGISTTRWRPGMHLLALALSGWIMTSCVQFDSQSGRFILATLGLAIAVTAAFGGDRIDRWRQISGTMLAHGMVLAYAGLFMIQFSGRSSEPQLWLWGSGTLVLLVGAIVAGWQRGNARVLWLSYVGFSIEIFALYVAKIGSLLGTSAFFFVMGLLVIALATLAYRMRAETALPQGAPS